MRILLKTRQTSFRLFLPVRHDLTSFTEIVSLCAFKSDYTFRLENYICRRVDTNGGIQLTLGRIRRITKCQFVIVKGSI